MLQTNWICHLFCFKFCFMRSEPPSDTLQRGGGILICTCLCVTYVGKMYLWKGMLLLVTKKELLCLPVIPFSLWCNIFSVDKDRMLISFFCMCNCKLLCLKAVFILKNFLWKVCGDYRQGGKYFQNFCI
jgi:hypothetical protein